MGERSLVTANIQTKKAILMQSKDIENQPIVEAVESDENSKKQLLIRDLGWTEAEVEETYYRLISFKGEWDAPGMIAYDEL